MQDAPQPARSWITEGLIIAAVPLIAYYLTFIYEFNFCRYFSISYEFISISPANVLGIAGIYFYFPTLLVIVVLWLIALRTLGVHFDEFSRRGPEQRAIRLICIWIIAILGGLILFYVAPDKFSKIAWGVFVFSYIVGPLLIPHLWKRIPGGTYWQNLKAEFTIIPRTEIPSRSLPLPINDILYFLALAFLLTYLPFGTHQYSKLGRHAAETQKNYHTIDQSPEVVVLRIYGDYLVTAPFDRQTKEVEKTFYLLKLSEISKTPLRLEEVGPLKVKQ